MYRIYNQQGIAPIAEYALTFFLVIAVILAMSTYIQRTLQGRMRDARIYMVETASSACGSDCLNATGLSSDTKTIGMQYEPYYVQTNALVSRQAQDWKTLEGVGYYDIHGIPRFGTGIFRAQTNTQNQSTASSNQLAPVAAAQDKVLGAQ